MGVNIIVPDNVTVAILQYIIGISTDLGYTFSRLTVSSAVSTFAYLVHEKEVVEIECMLIFQHIYLWHYIYSLFSSADVRRNW